MKHEDEKRPHESIPMIIALTGILLGCPLSLVPSPWGIVALVPLWLVAVLIWYGAISRKG